MIIYKNIIKDIEAIIMNLAHLRYFVELVNTRHYTKAAKRLCITQPSLSYAISQLENELGGFRFLKKTEEIFP